MEEQRKSVWSNGIHWISSKISKIWKHQQTQKNTSQPNIKCNILDRHPSDTKNLVLMKLRKPDTQNQLNKRIEKINTFFNKKVSAQKPLELVCPICIDYFVRPITTTCGHTFCQQCLDESILFAPGCPVCRCFIRGTDLIECKALHQIIFRYMFANKRFVGKHDDDIYRNNYIHQDKQAQNWIQRKKINKQNVKAGDLLDVRDTEYIWCRAIVNDVFRKNGRNYSILVHYLGWNSVYDQIIQLNSQRIANYKFYTSRFDIPHYHLNSENSENMHSYVVIGEPVEDVPVNLPQNAQNEMEEESQLNQEELFEMQENIEMVIEEGYVFVNSSEEDSIIEEDELENEIPMKENNPEDDRQVNKIHQFSFVQ